MFINPADNIKYLNLLPGMRVVDFGTGSGHYALALAEAVGGNGRVYVVDIQKDLAAKVVIEAKKIFLNNVEAIWGDIEIKNGVKLTSQIADAIVISNVLFQTDSPYGVALEAKRLLKPDGKILVIDWQDSYGNLGPTIDMILTEEKAIKIFAEAGFIVDNKFSAGDHHYGLVFKLK